MNIIKTLIKAPKSMQQFKAPMNTFRNMMFIFHCILFYFTYKKTPIWAKEINFESGPGLGFQVWVWMWGCGLQGTWHVITKLASQPPEASIIIDEDVCQLLHRLGSKREFCSNLVNSSPTKAFHLGAQFCKSPSELLCDIYIYIYAIHYDCFITAVDKTANGMTTSGFCG